MQEKTVMQCRVWAWVAWATTALLLVSGSIVMVAALEQWRIAGVLLISALAMSTVAATLHIRSFLVRVSSLVRAASYREVGEKGLRPVG